MDKSLGPSQGIRLLRDYLIECFPWNPTPPQSTLETRKRHGSKPELERPPSTKQQFAVSGSFSKPVGSLRELLVVGRCLCQLLLRNDVDDILRALGVQKLAQSGSGSKIREPQNGTLVNGMD